MIDNKIGKIVNLLLWLAGLLGLAAGLWQQARPGGWGGWILWGLLFLAWIRYSIFLYRKYIYQIH